jgi:hypothetical protein
MSVVCTVLQFVSYVHSSSESCRFRKVVCTLCCLCVFYDDEMCALLTGDVEVAPLSRNSILNFSVLPDKCIENYLKNNLYILIR